MKIMVLEPDKLLADKYVDFLAGAGHECVAIRQAGHAARALEYFMPDMIIMEISLAAHNGLEFLYEMRSYADTKHIKVLINSFVQDHQLPWGIVDRGDLGVIGHLHKPFTTKDSLLKAIA